MDIESVEAFQRIATAIEADEGYEQPAAFGLGVATLALNHPAAQDVDTAQDTALDTWFLAPHLAEHHASAALLARLVGHRAGPGSYRLDPGLLERAVAQFAVWDGDAHGHPDLDALRAAMRAVGRSLAARELYRQGTGTLADAVPKAAVVTFIGDLADPPRDIHDAYLRLHLLSARKVKPHGCNLDGIFGLLSNNVWTSHGPFAVSSFERVRATLMGEGVRPTVYAVDKFPRMVDYVVPTGVRIGDADRVRLGAYLGPGTTVMHEGFVNFNAGTLGRSMVEGRISAGVVVGEGSDIGGGASIMGTLSGGGQTVNSLGAGCLLGANAGCGIPLGDHCVIEAGCYVTAGAKVKLPDGTVVKAATLAGRSGLLFLRNSQTGAIEVRFKENPTALNEELHKN